MKITHRSRARRVARWAATLCLAAGAIFTFLPPVTSQAASYGTPYYSDIINANSGLCLSVPGASTAATAHVNQYPCGLYKDQYWEIGGLDETTT